MGIRALSHVWTTSKLRGTALLALMAIADSASDGEGEFRFAVEDVALKSRSRNIEATLRHLRVCGEVELYLDADGKHGTAYFNLPAFVSEIAERKPKSPLPHAAPRSGYVYVMQCGNAYKIGFSVDPQRRVEEIYPVMPYPVEIQVLLPTNDMRGMEKWLHERFNDRRLNGEWFALSDADLEFIRRMLENSSGA